MDRSMPIPGLEYGLEYAENKYTFIRTSKIEAQTGCSYLFPNFEAELFLICSLISSVLAV